MLVMAMFDGPNVPTILLELGEFGRHAGGKFRR
jgi:hypothetical protein